MSGRTRRSPMGRQAGSDTVSAQLRAAHDNDRAQAVVLRVESPGGSAVASEVIWREVFRLRESGKPVVVSMGDVAASGGYYIACPADVIVALPATLTGSIGVFGWQARGGRPAGTRRTQQRHRAAGRSGLDVLSSGRGSARTSGLGSRRSSTPSTTTSWARSPLDESVRWRRSKPSPGVACGLAGTPSRRVWSMSWAAFVTQFASPGNGRTCPRMHPCWVPSAFRRWRGSVGRRTVRIRGPGFALHGPAFVTSPLHLGCRPTLRCGCLISGCGEVGSTSHAAWGVDAVHGVHAQYSVSNLGTALRVLAHRSLSGSLVPLGEADECLGKVRWVKDFEVGVK